MRSDYGNIVCWGLSQFLVIKVPVFYRDVSLALLPLPEGIPIHNSDQSLLEVLQLDRVQRLITYFDRIHHQCHIRKPICINLIVSGWKITKDNITLPGD